MLCFVACRAMAVTHRCAYSALETCICRVDIDDIAMLGKWNNEHIVKSYVNGVPVAAVLARAGHDNLLHLLPRSTVDPDQSLLDQIFPGVEKILEEKKRVKFAAVGFAVMIPACLAYTVEPCMCSLLKLECRVHCLH